MLTHKIKITFLDKFTGKDLWDKGEVKSFCDFTPEPIFVNSKDDILPAIRYHFDIDDDVEVSMERHECYEDEAIYCVAYFSGSPERGCNMSDYQLERFKQGKCCGWNHDIIIRIEKVSTLTRPYIL